MKVFEVTTEYCDATDKIIQDVQYVTSDDNTLQSVVAHFTGHCAEYAKDLKGVREVLTIVEHIRTITPHKQPDKPGAVEGGMDD